MEETFRSEHMSLGINLEENEGRATCNSRFEALWLFFLERDVWKVFGKVTPKPRKMLHTVYLCRFLGCVDILFLIFDLISVSICQKKDLRIHKLFRVFTKPTFWNGTQDWPGNHIREETRQETKHDSKHI